jgi:hypothetical protein
MYRGSMVNIQAPKRLRRDFRRGFDLGWGGKEGDTPAYEIRLGHFRSPSRDLNIITLTTVIHGRSIAGTILQNLSGSSGCEVAGSTYRNLYSQKPVRFVRRQCGVSLLVYIRTKRTPFFNTASHTSNSETVRKRKSIVHKACPDRPDITY